MKNRIILVATAFAALCSISAVARADDQPQLTREEVNAQVMAARQSGELAGRRQMRRFDLALTRDLVEEIDGAAGEHTEQSNTHCHCEIHDASGNLPARQQE